jgi:hypothetical protein
MAAVTWSHLRLAAAPAAALVDNGRYLALARPADLRQAWERAVVRIDR